MTAPTTRLFAAFVIALAAIPAAKAQDPKDDPAKLKATIAAFQKEVADLKLKIASMDLEKLGARVSTEKPKEGGEVTTVNILKVWSGDKDTLARLKDLPNVQSVYVDNGQFNDASVAALKDLPALNSLTLMSPQVTDAALESLKGMSNLNMLFLTNTKVGDAGLAHLKDLKNLKVLALSRTQVTDKGLDALKEMKGLKSALPDRHQGQRRRRQEAQGGAAGGGGLSVNGGAITFRSLPCGW